MAVDLLQAKPYSLSLHDGRRYAEFDTDRLQIGFYEVTHITTGKEKMKTGGADGKLSDEEKKWLKKIAEKSDLLKNPNPQRGRK